MPILESLDELHLCPFFVLHFVSAGVPKYYGKKYAKYIDNPDSLDTGIIIL